MTGATRILIVEDDDTQRSVLEAVFKSEGYLVESAENGAAALQAVKSKCVDLVVCDVMMPVLDGVGFVEQLRKLPQFADLPVLMLTAADDSEREYNLLSLGADDYCIKTIRRKVLVKRVERLLARRKRTNPLQHLLND